MHDIIITNLYINTFEYYWKNPGSTIEKAVDEFSQMYGFDDFDASETRKLIQQYADKKVLIPHGDGMIIATSNIDCYTTIGDRVNEMMSGVGVLSAIQRTLGTYDGIVSREEMRNAVDMLLSDEITTQEFIFVMDTYMNYNGKFDDRCPACQQIYPAMINPAEVEEYIIEIDCNAKTEHFKSVCHLLNAYDANADGILSENDLHRADNDYKNGTLSRHEYICLAVCYLHCYSFLYRGGVINRLCSKCSSSTIADGTECIEGATVCMGGSHYECKNNSWVMMTLQSEYCSGVNTSPGVSDDTPDGDNDLIEPEPEQEPSPELDNEIDDSNETVIDEYIDESIDSGDNDESIDENYGYDYSSLTDYELNQLARYHESNEESNLIPLAVLVGVVGLGAGYYLNKTKNNKKP